MFGIQGGKSTMPESEALERIAAALERIAGYLDPIPKKRERRDAVLTTASYKREDKEWKQFEDEKRP